jgi:hypothetical protein
MGHWLTVTEPVCGIIKQPRLVFFVARYGIEAGIADHVWSLEEIIGLLP